MFCRKTSLSQAWLPLLVKYLAQRNHHEVAFVHVGVGEGERRRIDVEVVVCEYVDVDGAVMVLSVHRLGGAAELQLYVLGGGEELFWRQGGGDADAHVEEFVG